MVMIQDKEGIERFSITTKLNDMLIRIREKINNEDSMVLGILWGDVGCGKSVRAQHMAYVVDPSIELSKVCFDKGEFIDAVLNSRKQSIVGDEGISLFFSRGSMTKEGRLIAEMMAQCRQKNLFMLICVPELLSLDWLILKAANFVGYVWESRKKVNDKVKTMKGNLAIYPDIQGFNYKMAIIQYLKRKKSSPFGKLKRPTPYLLDAGSAINPDNNKVWYPVGLKYLEKKEDILKKYRNKDQIKKKPNEHVHNWRVRIRKGDKYCRKCGKIELLGGKGG